MNITIEQIKETVNKIHTIIGGAVQITLKAENFGVITKQKHRWEVWSDIRSQHYRFGSWKALMQWVSDLESSTEKIIIEETL